jgi:hypothetical protein
MHLQGEQISMIMDHLKLNPEQNKIKTEVAQGHADFENEKISSFDQLQELETQLNALKSEQNKEDNNLSRAKWFVSDIKCV